MRILLGAVTALVAISFSLAGSVMAQAMQIIDQPLLMHDYPYLPKTSPIHSYSNGLYVMTADWNGGGVCSEFYGSFWMPRFINLNLDFQGTEFIVGPDGGLFIYDADAHILRILLDNNTYEDRNCPGRPVFDQNGRIHIITELHQYYRTSDDTLNSYTTIDTLSNFPVIQRLIANPDHSTVGAVFYDFQNDNIVKYLSEDGFIDFSNPQIFPGEDLEDGIYDMVLNSQNELVAVVVHGQNSMYVDHYVWTEDFGYSYLSTGFDETLQPIYFEIAFGPTDDDILIIGNMLFQFYCSSWFRYSSDGGNFWYLSQFQIPDAAYGSSLRTYDDTLNFVYSEGLYGDTYYYPIPVDSITGNLTSINEEEIIPEVISLFRAYPNPFNQPVTIEFTLIKSANAQITIYAVNGARVETIRLFDRGAGKHTVVWDAWDVCSGVFFARLRAGGESRNIKLVLLK